MTLSRRQIEATASEHQGHLSATGLTSHAVLHDLGWDERRLMGVLSGSDATDPVDSWELRDYLVAAVQDTGVDVDPYTVLTDENRVRAQQWFNLRHAPRHTFE